MGERREPTGASTGRVRDGLRQAAVLTSSLLAVAGSVIGSGAFGGTPIAEASGGALAADATYVAPAGSAFSIWSVIYAGLVALAIWQVLPAQRRDERQRRVGWLVAASMLLNAAWVLSIQADAILLSVPVIVVLLVTLLVVFIRLVSTLPRSRVEVVVVDGTMGLYLGWVCIATVANVAAVLTDIGWINFDRTGEIWAVIGLIAAAAAGVSLAVLGRGRFAPAAGLTWGLAWVAAARLAGEPASTTVAVVALVCGAGVVVTTVALRLASLRRGGVERA